MDFEPTKCKCGGVVFDALAGFLGRGLLRPICPKCKRRVWIRFSTGAPPVVIRVDKRPARVPRDPLQQAPASDTVTP